MPKTSLYCPGKIWPGSIAKIGCCIESIRNHFKKGEIMTIFVKRIGRLFLPVLGISFFFLIAVTLARSDMHTRPDDDLQFLQSASANCLWKITLGDLARKQAASRDVREFGATMATDHERYHRELSRLAGRRGIAFKEEPDRGRKATGEYFSREYGAAFDRDYISLMIDDNQRDLRLYRQEAQKGVDAEIRAFAAAIIKKLEGYVVTAEKILIGLPKPVLK